jgi:hypothetical protein
MADASQAFSIVVPAGSGVATPQETELNLGLCDVAHCVITWPAGCCGLVGVALLAAESWAFPQQMNTFYAFDDFNYPFDVTNQIQTGDWSVVAYNLDYYDHTIQVVVEYDYVMTDQASPTPAQVSV